MGSPPMWDGKSLHWKDFLKEWVIFWSFQKDLVGREAKKWLFVKSLPSRWQKHMKSYITDLNWDFKEILQFMNRQCDILVPD